MRRAEAEPRRQAEWGPHGPSGCGPPGAERQETQDEELTAQLDRLPDLSLALRAAPPAIKRQVVPGGTSADVSLAWKRLFSAGDVACNARSWAVAD